MASLSPDAMIAARRRAGLTEARTRLAGSARPACPVMLARLVLLSVLALMLAPASGCARGGAADLTIRSTTVPNALLRGGFERGYYRLEDDNRVTMVLYDGPVEAPDQVVTLRMLWRPRAGRTPVESTATNVTIHYVIFAGVDRDEVGIYAGGGFIYPHNRIGDQTLSAGLWESSLQITQATPRFVDRLGQAVAQGRIRVIRDDVGLSGRLRDINLAIRDRLGYARMVDASPSPQLEAGDPAEPGDPRIASGPGATHSGERSPQF